MNEKEIILYLQNIIEEIKTIEYGDQGKRDRVLKKILMFFRRIFGEESNYISEINDTPFFPVNVARISSVDYTRENTMAWVNGVKAWINTLETIIEEINTFGLPENVVNTNEEGKAKIFKKIFIVHGHDGEMMQESARFVEKLGLEPIILKEQPDEGRTIIEKFEDFSDVEFAIVLFSPDDLGRAINTEGLNPRPRQNVVFELGFFIGKLGRKNVVVLHKVVEGFEMLSDFQGVLFKPYREDWELSVARELKAAGFDVDFNNLY